MFLMREQKREDKNSPWLDCGENYEIKDNPFTYGKIRQDRARAKKDGDSYRVYSEVFNNGLDSRPKTIIVTNKNTPNQRTVFTRINKSKNK